MRWRAWVLLLAACGEDHAGGPVVCAGSPLEPKTDCAEGYCVNGSTCEPIFDECGESEVPILGGGCQHVGPAENCWDGWLPDGEGGCEPILPKEECPTGTMPVIGLGDCQPVGLPVDCWEGWLPDGTGGCDPILPPGDCPDGTMPRIGEATCQPIGDCSTPPPTGSNVRHVDATLGPYTTIQMAIDDANPGDTVFVAAGEYDEDVDIGKPLSLQGQCPAEVTIRGTGASAYAMAIWGAGGAVELRGFTVTGAGWGIGVSQRQDVVVEELVVRDCGGSGIFVQNGATVIVRRSLLAGDRTAGALVNSSSVTFEDVVVRDSRADAVGQYGWGIGAQGSTIALLRSLVLGCREGGVVLEGSTGDIEEAVIQGTLAGAGNTNEGGLHIQEDSDVAMRRSLVAANRDYGVEAWHSTVAIEETAVRDTLLRESDGTHGIGILVHDDRVLAEPSRFALKNSLVSGNREGGIQVGGAVYADIDGVVVRDTFQPDAPWAQPGVSAVADLTGLVPGLSLHRALLSGNTGEGVQIQGAAAVIDEVVVRDSGRDGIVVYGDLDTGARSDVKVHRALIERTVGQGLRIAGSTAKVDEAVVRATLSDAAGAGGIGIAVQFLSADETTTATLSKCLVADNLSSDIWVSGSTAEIEDVTVRDTIEQAGAHLGRALTIENDVATGTASHVSVGASIFADGREAGVVIIGSTATLKDTRVRDTRGTEGHFGEGVWLWRPDTAPPTSATLEGVLLEGSAQAGIFFLDAGGSLHGSVVRGNTIGWAAQGGADPEVGEDNLFQDNVDDVAEGLNLEPPARVETTDF